MLPFVDLHAHSTYSFLDGCNQPEEIAERAAKLGRTAHAITDHGNVSVHPMWEKSALSNGIKPIFGVEAYFTPSVDGDRAAKRRYNSHLTILAENNVGYHNLLGMVSESFRSGIYYRALIDETNIKAHKEGLIVTSGCLSSMMSRLLLADRLDMAIKFAQQWEEMMGKGNYFLEAQLFPLEDVRKVNRGIIAIHEATGIPMICTSDVHMLDDSQDQQDNRRMLHCVREHPSRKWGDRDNEFTYAHGFLMDESELRAAAEEAGITPWLEEMAANTVAIAERCNVTLDKSHFIEFPLPDGKTDSRAYLIEQIEAGAKYRKIVWAEHPDYFDRVKYEMSLIVSKGYIDYFLVVADMVTWAKDHGIFVGPARGSSAGSLVCWLLRITEVNPMVHGLMFERFIDVTRTDLPDIDVDFDQERRKEVVHYMERRYGTDRVGLLGTFTGWKGKNSLDAVGNIFNIPRSQVEIVKGLLLERSSADSRMSFTIEDTFSQWPQAGAVAEAYPDIRKAALLDGQMRGWSTHACGIVLSSRPLEEICARYYRDSSGGDDGVTSVDYEGASYLGLLKIDALGLKALTVVRECANAVGMSLDDVYTLPLKIGERPELDDKVAATLQGFVDQDVQGIFQFEGGAMRSVLSQFHTTINFTELVHINALSRPGPLHGGMTTAFISVRNKVTEQGKMHPAVDALLDYTYGQVVYQEQVMAIAQQVGHMSWDSINQMRRAMSKKYGEEFFARLKVEFVTGAVEQSGMPEKDASDIWENIVTFGAWAFNISHAVSYSILSYWEMWFKIHHPTEFYAASCRHEEDDARLRLYLLEFIRKGGKVLPPHFNKSMVSWSVDSPMVLRAGFSSLKGIGDKVGEQIVAHQPYIDADDLAGRKVPHTTAAGKLQTRVIVNKAHMAALERVSAFGDEQAEGDFLLLGALVDALVECNPTHKIGSIQHADKFDEVVLSGVVKLRNLRSLKEVYQARNRLIDPNTGEVIMKRADAEVTKRPDLDEFINIHIEDDTGIIPCAINRYIYPKFKKQIWEDTEDGDIVVIRGIKDAGYLRIRATDYRVAFKKQSDGTYRSVGRLAEPVGVV